MTTVSIDIVSDVMCPWCYVGKKRLETALDMVRGAVDTDIRWRPFQLDPTLPPSGKDRQEYMVGKFGDRALQPGFHAPLVEAGAFAGIDFAFEKIEVAPNTLDAHRLIRWSASAGVQDEVVTRLFELYFEEGRNIGDPDLLADVAEGAGMDRDVVADLLASDADKEAVTAEVAQAQHMGVTGVPCFILEGKYAVTGAQDPAVLANAIRQVAAEKAQA